MCHGPHKELKSKKVEKNKDDIRAEQNMEKESGGQENKKGRDRERGEWGGRSYPKKEKRVQRKDNRGQGEDDRGHKEKDRGQREDDRG